MKKIIVLFILVSFYGCSEDPEQLCIEGTCYDVLSQATSYISNSIDILFVVDNSGSMAGEQDQLGKSFSAFATALEERFEDYHIAVVTTGKKSGACPACDASIVKNCVNETGEHGRFQDRLGHITWDVDNANFDFTSDPTCRVVTKNNKECFYNIAQERGIALVGTQGCGYERGLAAMKRALSKELLGTYNDGFLRDGAMLAVVVISDEDDCGEVGEVYELTPDGGNICYFAAKGVGPEGETVHPDDPNEKPYELTSVEEYRDFLVKLKGDRPGMVKFTAITGVKDINDLSTTTIEYEMGAHNRWEIITACTAPGCTGAYCFAEPGTRYIEMAQAFGLGINGQVDTICQDEFSYTMECTAGFMACQEKFPMSKPLPASNDSSIVVNNTLIPKYTCSVQGQIVACQGMDDTSCQEGMCVPSWTYQTPTESGLEGGTITFAEHLKPCDLVSDGEIKVSVITENQR